MITIRSAAIADVDIIAPLFDAYRIFYHQQPDPGRGKDFITQRLKNNESVIFIAFEENTPIGFTQLYPLFSSVSLKKLWLLNDLFIDPEYRKHGAATALLEEAKRFALTTGAKGLTLETGKDNLPAQTLYTKNGWVKEENFFYEFSI